MTSSALFSPDNKYRYSLSRDWDMSLPLLNFCMLNPSTADATVNDPTIERCIRRAKDMGYGGVIITNIFAFRSTDPKALKRTSDPIGWENDKHIIHAAQISKMTICGWGKHGSLYGRGDKVLETLKFWGNKIYALKVNKDGSPAHPLYIGYDVKPLTLRP